MNRPAGRRAVPLAGRAWARVHVKPLGVTGRRAIFHLWFSLPRAGRGDSSYGGFVSCRCWNDILPAGGPSRSGGRNLALGRGPGFAGVSAAGRSRKPTLGSSWQAAVRRFCPLPMWAAPRRPNASGLNASGPQPPPGANGVGANVSDAKTAPTVSSETGLHGPPGATGPPPEIPLGTRDPTGDRALRRSSPRRCTAPSAARIPTAVAGAARGRNGSPVVGPPPPCREPSARPGRPRF